MPNKLLLRRNSTAGVVPTSGTAATGQLLPNELGMNTADRRLYANFNGVIVPYVAKAFNRSLAVQSLTATNANYITGSNITLPAAGLVVGSCFRWTFNLTKTAAGTATSTINIRAGTLGTVADGVIANFTKPSGTAVVDEGKIVVEAVVRTIGASGSMVAEFFMGHTLAATGHLTTPANVQNGVFIGFNTTAVTQVGLSITPGTLDVCTIQMCMAEAWAL